jgi:small-conductance mechanosensitive channel
VSQPDLGFLGAPALGTCTNHPQVPAVQRCQQCRASICTTCDFQFPNNLHLCPKCATTTSRPMSTTRKQLLAGSLFAATFTTALLGALFSGVFANSVNDEVFAQVIGTVILISALLGLATSFASLDGRAGNPPLCWISVVWNVVLTVVWIGLCIIGLTMG